MRDRTEVAPDRGAAVIERETQTFEPKGGMGTEPLYKYRPWDDRTTDIITNSELYYSSPFDFNDPFDSRLAPVFEGNDAEWQLFGRHMEMDEDQLRALLAIQNREKKFNSLLGGAMVSRHAAYGICCLSRVRDDVLMWSHYASGHRGVCLRFEWDHDEISAYEVVYYSSFPRVNLLDAKLWEHGTVPFILAKSDRFEYEKECRVIQKGHGLRPYPREWLTGVILGCEMGAQERQAVTQLLSSRPDVEIMEAMTIEREFAINITTL